MLSLLKEKWIEFHDQWNNLGPIGIRGERIAAKYLRRKGCKIVGCGVKLPGGEVDIIAVDQRTIVFVEVKTRSSQDKGHPADAVDDIKQRKITRLAQSYCAQHNLDQHSIRFDIIAITWPHDQGSPDIEHFPAAFEAITGEFD